MILSAETEHKITLERNVINNALDTLYYEGLDLKEPYLRILEASINISKLANAFIIQEELD